MLAHHNLSKAYLNTNRVKYLLCTFYLRFCHNLNVQFKVQFRLESHTYYNNLDSRRIKSQEIPRLALVQASVGELNTEKRQRSHVSIVITTVNHFTVLIPSNLWLRETLWVAWKRDILSFYCGEIWRRSFLDSRQLYEYEFRSPLSV